MWKILAVLFCCGACFAQNVTIQAGSLGVNDKWTPGLSEWFAERAKTFGAAHPGMNVDLLAVDGPARDRLPIEEIPVLARNVVGIDSVSGYEAAWLAVRGDIVPIDKFLPDPEFKKEDFYGNLWDPVTFDGKIWAVPLAAAPLAFAFQPDLLEKAGFKQPPKTWEELASCARTAASASGMPDGFRPLYIDDPAQVILTMLLQKGEGLMHDNRFDPVMESIIDNIELARPLLEMQRGDDQNMNTTAMVIGNPRTFSTIPRTARAKWRFAPLPTSGEEAQAPYQVIYLAVRSARPEYEAASWEFVKHMLLSETPPPFPVVHCRNLGGVALPRDRQDIDWDTGPLYSAVGQIQDYGPNNLLGRREALEMLGNAAGELFQRGRPQGYGEALAKANGLLTVINMMRTPGQALYALYR